MRLMRDSDKNPRAILGAALLVAAGASVVGGLSWGLAQIPSIPTPAPQQFRGRGGLQAEAWPGDRVVLISPGKMPVTLRVMPDGGWQIVDTMIDDGERPRTVYSGRK